MCVKSFPNVKLHSADVPSEYNGTAINKIDQTLVTWLEC